MLTLSPNEIGLLAIVAVALLLIVTDRIRADLVAIFVLLALGLSRILRPEQALAGFSAPAVLTIVGLFVITAALERAGVVLWLSDRLAALSGSDEPRMVAVFMLAGALLSLLMNNIAAGAVLLPAAVDVARRSRVSPSRVLMPLAFGTLLGGMATLFTTANIIVSGSLQAQGQRGLTMLDFLITGGPLVVAGTLYMLLIGRRLLPRRESAVRAAVAIPNLAETYQLADRLWEVKVQPGSPLVQQRLADSVIGARLGATVLGIWHGGEAKIPPAPSEVIDADDILLILGREERVRQLEAQGTTIGRNTAPRDRRIGLPVGLTEVLIGPRSPALGQTLKELRFRGKFGLTAVALWRAGRSYRTDVGDFTLQPGDALLMVGPPASIRALADEPGFIVLDRGGASERHLTKRAPLAALITAAVLLASALGLVPTAEAMLSGAALLVLFGCLNMEEAYRAIEWRVVVLIAGMLPIGTALAATGLATQIGQIFIGGLATSGPLALVAALFLFTVALTQFVGGQVAALIVGPIAVSTGVALGVNPVAIGAAVSIACSTAFLTPIAHPVNVLMMGPGGYEFKDFLRIGLGLVVVCFATLMLVMALVWGL